MSFEGLIRLPSVSKIECESPVLKTISDEKEKLQKELEKTQKELDKIRGKDTSKTKGEMDSPLSDPPKTEQKKNDMQPTLLGDDPVQNQKKVEGPQKTNPSQERTGSHQINGENKTTNKEEKKSEQLLKVRKR